MAGQADRAGPAAAAFVPPPEIRRLREFTRLRTNLVCERTRYWARLEKLLERALIKISVVLSKLTTDTARAMIEALIAGQRNPKILAELAIGKARSKRAELAEALDSDWQPHHSELARILLDQIDALTVQIDALTDRVSELIDQIPAAWGADADGVTGRRSAPARTLSSCLPWPASMRSPAAGSSPPRPSSPRSAWT